MKFRRDSDEEMCFKVVTYTSHSDGKDYSVDAACSRTKGHEGFCVALMCDAALADNVCGWCRASLDGEHRTDCDRPPLAEIKAGLAMLESVQVELFDLLQCKKTKHCVEVDGHDGNCRGPS